MSDSNYQDPNETGSLDELCDLLLEEEGVSASDSTRRPLLETLAMLPFGLDSVAPSAGAKERLFDRIAEERASSVGKPAATVHSLAERRAERTAVDPGSEPFSQQETSQRNSSATKASSAPVKPGWLLPVAASLLLALGSFSYFQASEVRSQRTALAEIQAQMNTVESKLQMLEVDRDRALTHLAQVSRPGTEACALSPRFANSNDLVTSDKQAHGTLYFMPEGQGWVLSLDGLEDVPGKTYQLWFLNDEAALSGGTFDTGNRPYELTHSKMPPPGTRAVAITLEIEGGVAAPTGPEVLFGDAADMISFL